MLSLRLTGREFRAKQWRQLQQRQTTGQRLGHLRHQRRGYRAEEEESSKPFAIVIDCPAQPWKDLWPFLRLVENHKALAGDNFVPRKIESQAITLLLQVKVVSVERASHGCLSALTRTSKSDSRVRSQSFVKFPSYCPV